MEDGIFERSISFIRHPGFIHIALGNREVEGLPQKEARAKDNKTSGNEGGQAKHKHSVYLSRLANGNFSSRMPSAASSAAFVAPSSL